MASLVENRKAHFNYELIDTFEAGIELLGSEVKSLRKGQGSLEGAYVVVRGGEAFLVGATIAPFQSNNVPEGYNQVRIRRLLLTKREIASFAGLENKRLTIIPISVYNKGRKIKVMLASARGKKKFDKRESIKKREAKREIGRTLKNSF